MLFPPDGPAHGFCTSWTRDPAKRSITAAWLADETEHVAALLPLAILDDDQCGRVAARAAALVDGVRAARPRAGGLDDFLREFELSSQEGLVLMCLAEALLRIPDAPTVDKLIREKVTSADWAAHFGHSDSIFVNASTLALMLTGRIIQLGRDATADLGAALGRLVSRSGEPVIRQAVTRAMRILGGQFVMGRTIGEALKRAAGEEGRGYRHSFDMLGEGARTAAAADAYMAAYVKAIEAIGEAARGEGPTAGPGLSVKLSALHPRYEFDQADRALTVVLERVRELARLARRHDIGLTIDAEEAGRLQLGLELFEILAKDPSLKNWDGLGLAVQAYQKRAAAVVDWLAPLAAASGRRIPVRLVKGAYWDTEIKQAQVKGLDGYPVFTRKVNTDLSYLACARKLFAASPQLYPQFATHNAHTVAAVMELAAGRPFEFQRLHGMGELLYRQLVAPAAPATPCRVYAPVGPHADLLAYLARRLLENGANTSFVNRLVDEKQPVEALIADPANTVRALDSVPHPAIAWPRDLFGGERLAAQGIELDDPRALDRMVGPLAAAADRASVAAPIVAGEERDAPEPAPIVSPADHRSVVGHVTWATADHTDAALAAAAAAAAGWDAASADTRATVLERAAALLEDRLAVFMALAIREGGKTIPDALAEVREAVDFLRYYAVRARADFGPARLPGPTGEHNRIALHGRGVFACISPWNFPLAIFLGQVAAALAAGNAVAAKPAEQTPLIAAAAVRLLHEAGIPPGVLHMLPGDGAVGARLVRDARIAGVAFTGGTDTARAINQALAARPGPIVPLIAETGGQNTMIVDSSALSEQVVDDVITSAFRSAGQRCSALRILFVQNDVAARLLPMLAGAVAELRVGDPALLSTDVGPVIDGAARTRLRAYADTLGRRHECLAEAPLGPDTRNGTFVSPQAYAITMQAIPDREVFGPILHVIRFDVRELDAVVDRINATGYGLTLGIHSRLDSTVEQITRRIRAGNAYVNRNMIGAVVGVQPFGGEGLSGTGPKAGGPRYLHRFALERVVSVNTAAAGGNTDLMRLSDDPTPTAGLPQDPGS